MVVNRNVEGLDELCTEGFSLVGNWQWWGTRRGPGPTLSVALHMQSQVVRTAEAPVAMTAFERFRPRVLAVVAGQLVAPGESPFASFPGAFVWLLPCKRDEN